MKTASLSLWDLLLLSLIFFGYPIWASSGLFLAGAQEQGAGHALQFSAADNWRSIAFELVSLLLAYAYLRWRRFDFSRMDLSLNRYTLPKALAWIALAGLAVALFDYARYLLFAPPYAEALSGDTAAAADYAADYGIGDYLAAFTAYLSPSFLLFALLNGFYEEVFFLGLVFCTAEKYRPAALLFSLLLRFAFHTYQGIDAALSITLLGVLFCLLRLRHKALPPFMLAHSFFDLFGLNYLFNLVYVIWYLLAA